MSPGLADASGSGYYCDAPQATSNPQYVPGYSSCPDIASAYVTSHDFNEAYTYYQNDGDYVCQEIQGQSVSGNLSRTCGQNSAQSGNGDYLDTYDVHYYIVGNDSPKQHYVDGYYYYY